MKTYIEIVNNKNVSIDFKKKMLSLFESITLTQYELMQLEEVETINEIKLLLVQIVKNHILKKEESIDEEHYN